MVLQLPLVFMKFVDLNVSAAHAYSESSEEIKSLVDGFSEPEKYLTINNCLLKF